MKPKQWALVGALIATSIALGFSLSNLDFFGFLREQHTLDIVFLASSLILWYFLLLIIFLLEFSQIQHLLIALWAATLSFSVANFIGNWPVALIFFNSVLYFLFLLYSYYAVQKRANLFLKFSAQQIFIPVMKRGFTFLIVLFALMSYFQVTQKIKTNELFGPEMIRPITRPAVTIINKQLTTQIRTQLAQIPQFGSLVTTEILTRLAVDQVVNTITDSGKKDFYGIPGSAIDSKLIAISQEGDIDVSPLVDSLLPLVINETLEKLGLFSWLFPVVISLIVVLLLQPILYLFELFLYIPTPIVFKLLMASGFIHIEKETVEREKLVI
ncbi:MAG: hypothetical protein WC775_05560 [Patescibacteria group bacterium]|jgi:hypothetical protein